MDPRYDAGRELTNILEQARSQSGAAAQADTAWRLQQQRLAQQALLRQQVEALRQRLVPKAAAAQGPKAMRPTYGAGRSERSASPEPETLDNENEVRHGLGVWGEGIWRLEIVGRAKGALGSGPRRNTWPYVALASQTRGPGAARVQPAARRARCTTLLNAAAGPPLHWVLHPTSLARAACLTRPHAFGWVGHNARAPSILPAVPYMAPAPGHSQTPPCLPSRRRRRTRPCTRRTCQHACRRAGPTPTSSWRPPASQASSRQRRPTATTCRCGRHSGWASNTRCGVEHAAGARADKRGSLCGQAGHTVPPVTLGSVRPSPPRSRSSQDIVTGAAISSAQLETIIYACQRFQQRLPDGSRAGFFLVRQGTHTTLGEGRQRGAACGTAAWPPHHTAANTRPTPRNDTASSCPPAKHAARACPPFAGRWRGRGQGPPDCRPHARIL
jgi:hypothetical protein